jgi:hypothetical protein
MIYIYITEVKYNTDVFGDKENVVACGVVKRSIMIENYNHFKP